MDRDCRKSESKVEGVQPEVAAKRSWETLTLALPGVKAKDEE